MGIKRCPSFSKRPDFPCGLRVLLVDGDDVARSRAEERLMECSYTVSSVSVLVIRALCATSYAVGSHPFQALHPPGFFLFTSSRTGLLKGSPI